MPDPPDPLPPTSGPLPSPAELTELRNSLPRRYVVARGALLDCIQSWPRRPQHRIDFRE